MAQYIVIIMFEREVLYLRKRAKSITKEVKKRISTAILGAFALIIALVWNDAIGETVKKIIEYTGLTTTLFLYKIITAVLVTLVCVIGILYFSRWVEK
jgi:uncharacterized membrane protein